MIWLASGPGQAEQGRRRAKENENNAQEDVPEDFNKWNIWESLSSAFKLIIKASCLGCVYGMYICWWTTKRSSAQKTHETIQCCSFFARLDRVRITFKMMNGSIMKCCGFQFYLWNQLYRQHIGLHIDRCMQSPSINTSIRWILCLICCRH